MPCGTAFDDPSRSGSADGSGFCANHRKSGSVRVWQADRKLFGTGTTGGLERESATAGHPGWRSKYHHLMMRRGRKIAKVAMARRLAVRMYWMMRKGWNYEQLKKFGSHAGQPGNRHGVKSNTE